MTPKTPRKGAIDGPNEPYFYPDGTVVSLQFTTLAMRGVRGNYLGVEVRGPSYVGYYC